MRRFRLIRNIVLILLILALNVVVYVEYREGYSWGDVWTYVSGSTLSAILVIIGLHCLKTVVWVIPIYALYIGAGFLLPVGPAIAATYMGLIVDFTVSFCLGRYMGRSRVVDEIKRRKAGKWMLDLVDKNSDFACFVMRTLPGPPTEVTNMLFGALNIQYCKFMILSLLGMTPGMLPVIFIGKAATNPMSKEFILPLLISLVIAVSSSLIYFLFLKKRNQS